MIALNKMVDLRTFQLPCRRWRQHLSIIVQNSLVYRIETHFGMHIIGVGSSTIGTQARRSRYRGADGPAKEAALMIDLEPMGGTQNT